ncbi:IS5 family transposase, partial [Filifactor villosus]
KGTIVDAAIISSPSSTKNQSKQRNMEAHQTKKGNNWYFGYKAHIGVDAKNGLVHSVKVSAANVHDVTMVPELLTGEEKEVYGDSAYLGAERREEARKRNKKGQKINYKINKRRSQSREKSARSKGQIKRREREKSSIRSKVEHVFGIIKARFGYRKTRYKGLKKQEAKLNILCSLANLLIAQRRSLSA